MVREDGSSVLVARGRCVITVVVCPPVPRGILVEARCSCLDAILMSKGKVTGGVQSVASAFDPNSRQSSFPSRKTCSKTFRHVINGEPSLMIISATNYTPHQPIPNSNVSHQGETIELSIAAV